MHTIALAPRTRIRDECLPYSPACIFLLRKCPEITASYNTHASFVIEGHKPLVAVLSYGFMDFKVATNLGATPLTKSTLAWVTGSPWIAGEATNHTSRMAPPTPLSMTFH